MKFNFDNYNSATKIIKALKGVLIEDKIARELLSLIRFRNYIIHSHYLNENKQKMEENFPDFLFMILPFANCIFHLYKSITVELISPHPVAKSCGKL